MKIVNLLVDNFRAVGRIELTDLQDMVVIAGPNGCGKSCVLDAIRLFKSVYGGYQPNEWHQWFGEFQINFQRNPQQMAALLRDRSKPAVIQAGIELATEEIAFVSQQLLQMLEEAAWNSIVPGARQRQRTTNALAAEIRANQPIVDQRVRELLPMAQAELAQPVHYGRLQIDGQGTARTDNNILLELVFSSFYPNRIGVIDYHGAHRDYAREQLGGINLNLDQEEDRYKAASLYNYANKYTNIKSEMAAEYVKQALIEKSNRSNEGGAINGRPPLSETLQDLFSMFFPGKTFGGPVPTDDGNLDFPVTIDDGSTHDINDLSSGEKEILFGYLRLRNSAPKYSVVLVDEPELHLNPALVRGLPQFHYKYMGLDLENQIWLVTHSDAYLREAMGQAGIRVFHMQHAGVSGTSENQIREISHDEQVEALILEMVGNLATYRPGAKVIFFEGGDSEFDVKMVSRLFPSIANQVNLISGGSRARVEMLQEILDHSVQAGNIPVKIYSVVDKDSGSPILPNEQAGRSFSWDVYHIENYLLEPRFISQVLRNLSIQCQQVSTEAEVELRLKEIAKGQIGKLVAHRVRAEINTQLTAGLNLQVNPLSEDLGAEFDEAIEKSVGRINGLRSDELEPSRIGGRIDRERASLEASLINGDWRQHFKGRDVLREFVGKFGQSMRYIHFRELIISQMVSADYQPEGMKAILDSIMQD